MDCKKALMEANGDFEAAVDYLRKKGAKVSASRSDRDAKEGVVIAKTTSDGKRGIVIELNCETDFVAKNADFVAFGNAIADAAVSENPANLEALLNLKVGGNKLSETIIDQTGKIGEKIGVSKYEVLSGEKVIAYIHAGYKLGVLVGLSADAGKPGDDAGKDVAMQIAAMNPVALDKGDVDASIIERELEIAKDVIRAEGKPEEMVDKIAAGKLNKFYKDSTLLNQEFVKDSSKTITQMLDGVHKGLTVNAFKRVALGA